jgi:tetratricopeptide (TPR) repeat protein
MEKFLKKEKGMAYIFPDGATVDVEDTEEMARRVAALKEQQEGMRNVLLELGGTCLQEGYREAGVVYIAKAMALADDRMKAGVCLRIGLWLESLQDFESAARIYALAVGGGPGRADHWYFVHNNLGYCLNMCGRFAEAEPYCRAAIRIDAGAHNAYKNLGLSLAGQRQYAEAARQFVKAFETCPGDPRSFVHLEDMLLSHPEAAAEVPDIAAWVATLRAQAMPRTGLH